MKKKLKYFLLVACYLNTQIYANDTNKEYETCLKNMETFTIAHNPPINIENEHRCFNILEIFTGNPITFCNPFNRPKKQLKNQLTNHYNLGPHKMSQYPEKKLLQSAVLQHYGITMKEPKTATCCAKSMDYQKYHDRFGACFWTTFFSSMLCFVVDPGCATVSCVASSCVLCAQRAFQLNDIKIKQKE